MADEAEGVIFVLEHATGGEGALGFVPVLQPGQLNRLFGEGRVPIRLLLVLQRPIGLPTDQLFILLFFRPRLPIFYCPLLIPSFILVVGPLAFF